MSALHLPLIYLYYSSWWQQGAGYEDITSLEPPNCTCNERDTRFVRRRAARSLVSTAAIPPPSDCRYFPHGRASAAAELLASSRAVASSRSDDACSPILLPCACIPLMPTDLPFLPQCRSLAVGGSPRGRCHNTSHLHVVHDFYRAVCLHPMPRLRSVAQGAALSASSAPPSTQETNVALLCPAILEAELRWKILVHERSIVLAQLGELGG